MSRPFIYDEKTSILYDSYGNYIKHVYCPEAKVWNQIINDDPSCKTRFCETCSGRVINLDAIPPAESLAILKADPNTCIFAGKKSPNVVYLNAEKRFSIWSFDTHDFYKSANKKNLKELRISTDLTEINEAVRHKYWPDVIHSVSISLPDEILRYFQHKDTGYLTLDSDSGNLMDPNLERIYSSEYVAFAYLQFSIAAYLIPPGLKDGERFFIRKPIAGKTLHGSIDEWSAEATIKDSKVLIDASTLVLQYVHIG